MDQMNDRNFNMSSASRYKPHRGYDLAPSPYIPEHIDYPNLDQSITFRNGPHQEHAPAQPYLNADHYYRKPSSSSQYWMHGRTDWVVADHPGINSLWLPYGLNL